MGNRIAITLLRTKLRIIQSHPIPKPDLLYFKRIFAGISHMVLYLTAGLVIMLAAQKDVGLLACGTSKMLMA